MDSSELPGTLVTSPIRLAKLPFLGVFISLRFLVHNISWDDMDVVIPQLGPVL